MEEREKWSLACTIREVSGKARLLGGGEELQGEDMLIGAVGSKWTVACPTIGFAVRRRRGTDQRVNFCEVHRTLKKHT